MSGVGGAVLGMRVGAGAVEDEGEVGVTKCTGSADVGNLLLPSFGSSGLLFALPFYSNSDGKQ